MGTNTKELMDWVDWYQNFMGWVGDAIGEKFRRSSVVRGYQYARYIIDDVVVVQCYCDSKTKTVIVQAYASEDGAYMSIMRIPRGLNKESCVRAVQDAIIDAVSKRYDLTSDTRSLW